METESRLVAARVCGKEEWAVTANRYGASFWDHNNVMKLDSGDSYTDLWIY